MEEVNIDTNSFVHDIEGITFGILSPEQMRDMSVCEITHCPDIPRELSPEEAKLYGTLDDPRLGARENTRESSGNIIARPCKTCGLSFENCPGHFGYMKLGRPCFVQIYFQSVVKILQCVCFRCGHVLLNEEQRRFIIRNTVPKNRISLIKDSLRKSKCECEYCGATQPISYTVKKDPSYIITRKFEISVGSQKQLIIEDLKADTAWDILHKIPDTECLLLGMNPELTKPSSLIWTCIPISPPQVRPSVEVRGKKNMDDLTHFLKDIFNTNRDLYKAIEAKEESEIKKKWECLQGFINAYIDNNTSKSANCSKTKTSQPLVSIKTRIGSKSGRIRQNLMGKRTNNTARSVLTCDPDIDADQLGVPVRIAKDMTFPEKVTVYNKEFLEKLVSNGPDIYPGAIAIVRKRTGQRYNIKGAKNLNKLDSLEIGDTVHRHLIDNDLVMFNRQPSLHRMSIMCHRIKVLDYDTFRISANVTTPYNADFDGDEMNLLSVTNYSQLAELKYLMHISTQMISPQFNTPIIGTVQDSTLGPFLMSEQKFIQPSWYQQIIGNVYRGIYDTFDINKALNLENPSKFELGEKSFNSRNIFSQLFPKGFDYNSKAVHIIDSIVVEQPGDFAFKKAQLSNGKYNSIFQTAFNTLGPNQSIQLLNKIGRFANNYILYNGFGLGIRDCFPTSGGNFVEMTDSLVHFVRLINENVIGLFSDTPSSNEKKVLTKIVDKIQKEYAKLLKKYPEAAEINKLKDKITNLETVLKNMIVHTQREIKESFAGNIYDATTDYIKPIVDSNSIKQFESGYNAMERMITGGSKGGPSNMAQMIGALGRQDLEGHWVTSDLNRRTLVYFTRDDYRPSAHGYIGNSYLTGLTPTEYYFAAMSGRSQQIGKSIKPAETGYTQHKIIKTIEDTHVGFDGSVRGTNNFLLETLYGNDSFNVANLIETTIKIPIWYSFDDFTEHLYTKYTIDNYMVNCTGNQIFEEEESLMEKLYPIVHNTYYSTAKIMLPIDIFEKVATSVESAKLKKTKNTNGATADSAYKLARQLYDKVSVLFNNGTKFYKIAIILMNILVTMNSQSEIVNNFPFLVEEVTSDIYSIILNALALNTENIGVIAAQSIGQPLTQATLNSFHAAGAKSAITGGAPRIKELLSNTSPSTPSINIALPFTFEKGKADDLKKKRFKQAEDIVSYIKNIKFKDIIVTYTAKFSNNNENIISKFLFKVNDIKNYKLRLDFVIDKYYILSNNLDLLKINLSINRDLRQNNYTFVTDYNVTADECVYSVFVVPKINNGMSYDLFIEGVIAVLLETKFTGIDNIKDSWAADTKIKATYVPVDICEELDLDNVSNNYKFNHNDAIISEEIFIADNFNEDMYNKVNSVYPLVNAQVVTVGTNLEELLSTFADIINPLETYSNDPMEMYNLFGIEVYRSSMKHELNLVMNPSKDQVIDHRHHTLLVNSMSRKGYPTNIDRHGVIKNGSEVLQSATFEQPIKVFTDACLSNEVDNMKGISNNIMFGQLLKTGTNASTLRLNLDLFKKYAKLIEKPEFETTAEEQVTKNFGLLFKIRLDTNI